MITVKELIEKLEEMPQDMTVGIHYEKDSSSEACYLTGVVYMIKGWDENKDGVFLIHD